ncbi:MAG: NPCBM/NEW2 domain-containing protein [Phycisphaerales bacterium]|nr:NPCBM/NEW2 domain-containing protein [Phycisphaerales bacterium]
MNGEAHRRIMKAALGALPENEQKILALTMDQVPDAGNYPDFFDDPTRPEADKNAIDPEWRRFCRFPSNLAAAAMHHWPYNQLQSEEIRPMLEHLFSQCVQALAGSDILGAVKFIGCLSHYLGDATQPAHLIDIDLMERLVPPPEKYKGFHYHHDLEAITGQCSRLEPAEMLGASVAESMWRLADYIGASFESCQQYIVPSLQAIFADNIPEAERLAGLPMTISAQLTLHVMHTAIHLAKCVPDRSSDTQSQSVDLCDVRPVDFFNDMVYGGVIRDGNRDHPPRGKIVPAKLRIGGQIRAVHGLGVFPHSGISRARDCYLTYSLPNDVFTRFECQVGLHPEIATGAAVEFMVELDGQIVWQSGRLTEKDDAAAVSIPVKQAKRITLRAVDASGGKSFWTNHCVWGQPVLIRADGR